MLSTEFATWVFSFDVRERTVTEVKPMSLTARFQSAGYSAKRAESLQEFFAARSSK